MILAAQNVLDDLDEWTGRFENSKSMNAARELPGYQSHRIKMHHRTKTTKSLPCTQAQATHDLIQGSPKSSTTSVEQNAIANAARMHSEDADLFKRELLQKARKRDQSTASGSGDLTTDSLRDTMHSLIHSVEIALSRDVNREAREQLLSDAVLEARVALARDSSA